MDLKIKLIFLNLYKIIYMRKLPLLLPIFFFFVSCQNTGVDDIDLAEDIPQNITSLSQMTSSLLDVYFSSINIGDGQNNKREDEDKDEDKDEKEICFEIVLPVSFNMPDGSIITIDNKEDWKVLYNWYKENEDSDDKPEIILPFNVIIGDDEITISNDEEFQRLLDFIDNECKDESDEKNEECYEFVLPVSFSMPDGSVLTIETEEDWEELEKWYDDNKDSQEEPELIFPVQLIIDEEAVTVNTEEEFKKIEDECDSKEDDDEREDEEECYKFVLPISFNMPDGTVLTIETEDDWKKLERWYRENDNTSEEPEIIFPVQVIYEDETLTINSAEELKELEEDCKED